MMLHQNMQFGSFSGFGSSLGKTKMDSSILAKLKSAMLLIPNVKPACVDVGESGEICSDCNCEMSPGDMGYICTGCGKNGGELEIHEQTIQITLQNNQTQVAYSTPVEMRVRSNDDKFNQTYIATFTRLQRQHAKQSDYHIPLNILRETAHLYATICHQSAPAGSTTKSTHRHNLILSSLLQNQLDKANMSKPDGFVCQFTGVAKSKLTKSKNRLQTFIKSGAVEHVHPYDRIPNFVYLFLTKLGVDTVHTDLVVAIIRRADEQVDMIRFRTCQDNSKVVGAIWLVARQLNLKVQHQVIFDSCEHISKSTYIRYVEFLDYNRRRINPILVKYKVRPIPKSFALPRGRRDAASRSLGALPEQYRGDFQYTPDPVKIQTAPAKRAGKKSKAVVQEIISAPSDQEISSIAPTLAEPLSEMNIQE